MLCFRETLARLKIVQAFVLQQYLKSPENNSSVLKFGSIPIVSEFKCQNS